MNNGIRTWLNEFAGDILRISLITAFAEFIGFLSIGVIGGMVDYDEYLSPYISATKKALGNPSCSFLLPTRTGCDDFKVETSHRLGSALSSESAPCEAPAYICSTAVSDAVSHCVANGGDLCAAFCQSVNSTISGLACPPPGMGDDNANLMRRVAVGIAISGASLLLVATACRLWRPRQQPGHAGYAALGDSFNRQQVSSDNTGQQAGIALAVFPNRSDQQRQRAQGSDVGVSSSEC